MPSESLSIFVATSVSSKQYGQQTGSIFGLEEQDKPSKGALRSSVSPAGKDMGGEPSPLGATVPAIACYQLPTDQEEKDSPHLGHMRRPEWMVLQRLSSRRRDG